MRVLSAWFRTWSRIQQSIGSSQIGRYMPIAIATGIPKFNHFEFVAACAAFPRAPLSIGWTTGPPQSSSLPLPLPIAAADAASMPQSSEVGYEDGHVDEMIELCKQGATRDCFIADMSLCCPF